MAVQLLQAPPTMHEFDGWSGMLSAPVCVLTSATTVASVVRFVVVAEIVKGTRSIPEVSMLIDVGATVGATVGRLPGHDDGQKVIGVP